MHHSKCLKCGGCHNHNQPKYPRRHRTIRTPAGAVARCRSAFGTKSYIPVFGGPAASGGGGGAPGQGNTSGPARGNWLGKFFVGGVPLCYGINRAMRGVPGGWWQAACAACCMCVRHLLRSYLQPPHTYYSCSQPTFRSLSVLLSIPTTTYPLVLPHHQPTLPSPTRRPDPKLGKSRSTAQPIWWLLTCLMHRSKTD
jgi:hypothetical protein